MDSAIAFILGSDILAKPKARLESSSTSRSQSQSPFLQLPIELRLQIYAYLLAPTHLSSLRRISSRGYCSDYVLPPRSLCPALLSTCRQIHDEAIPVLYGLNTFVANQTLLTDLPYLVTKGQPVTHGAGRDLIKKWYINVRLDTDARYSKDRARKAFSGVDELEIDVFQAMYGGADFAVLSLFEDVRGVGRCTIHGSIGDGRYADWLQNVMCSKEGSVVSPFCESHASSRHVAGKTSDAKFESRYDLGGPMQIRASDDLWKRNR